MALPETPAQPSMNSEATGVVVDNRTELPDAQVLHAVRAHFVESAGLQFAAPSTFQMYATNQGSNMLTRNPFRTPLNVVEEIKIAREVATHDDDVVATINQTIATAFGEGMENQHTDERTTKLFNKICGPLPAGGLNMDMLLKEMLREYLIASQFTTVALYTRTRYNFTPSGGGERVQEQLATPIVGILPAEHIRVLTNDLFGDGELAFDPSYNVKLAQWLRDYFAATPAKQAALAREEPVIASMFTEEIVVDRDDDFLLTGQTVYKLNPRMARRTTMPKGAAAYPTPLLTANFALLEAKRLLNIMDYSLLQGGTNYIVVARTGSDKLPAQQPEVDALTDEIRAASRTGVLVGDHRLTLDIITPDLKELLNPSKRKLLGRKLAMALLRIPEQVTDDSGNAGAQQELEFTARTITSDRRDVIRHVEGHIYDEIATRNPSVFKDGSPSLWCPKIVLSGLKDFFANVVQARDRGDIPRKWAVEVLGFDYEAGVAQRSREKANGDDEVLTPGAVPFAGDPGGQGRPPGVSPDNGRPGATPGNPPGAPPQRAPVQLRPHGEAILSHWDGQRTVRYGELTAAVVEQFPEHTVGRMGDFERQVVASEEVQRRGTVIGVPVNPTYDVGAMRVFRLNENVSMVVGEEVGIGALVARALIFRAPAFSEVTAAEEAQRWGFVTEVIHETPQLPAPQLDPPAAPPTADEIVASAATAAQAAFAGVNVPEVIAQAQQGLATAVATAVVSALRESGVVPAPAPPAE